MTEYIDRNALLQKIRWASDAEEAVISVRRMPAADVVEVVRCNDCKHCNISLVIPNGRVIYTCMEGSHDHKVLLDPTDFCSYGERKEGAE